MAAMMADEKDAMMVVLKDGQPVAVMVVEKDGLSAVSLGKQREQVLVALMVALSG